MKFRVHYTTSRLRGEQRAEISAENKGAAAATFAHHNPQCRISRIEELAGQAKPRPPAQPVATVPPEPEPVDAGVRERIRGQVDALRSRLNVPATRRGRVSDGPSVGHWFARGKEARLHGEARDKVDGRMSPENRTAFQAGWDEQERFMQPPSEAQIEQSAETARKLREWAAANL